MNTNEMKEKLRAQLSELLDMDGEKITDDTNILDLGATSMVIVQLFVYIDDEFGVNLEDKLDLHVTSVTINSLVDEINEQNNGE